MYISFQQLTSAIHLINKSNFPLYSTKYYLIFYIRDYHLIGISSMQIYKLHKMQTSLQIEFL